MSLLSLAWTLAVGATSVGIGLSAGSLAVVAFGATGLLDAVGSASLVLQFVHARQRGATSHLFETITLRIVTVGLALTAIATIHGFTTGCSCRALIGTISYTPSA